MTLAMDLISLYNVGAILFSGYVIFIGADHGQPKCRLYMATITFRLACVVETSG